MLDVGEIYQVAVDIRDAAGALANPATATLTITLPDGTTASPSVALPPTETGKLRVDYTTVQPGRHVYRLVTTGPTTAFADMFEVAAAEPGQIVSLADTKAHLNIPATKTTDDEELRGFVLAATEVVERYAGAVVRRTHSQTFDGGREAVVLAHAPVLSITSVTESGTTVTAGGYNLDTASGVLVRMAGGFRYCWRPGAANIIVSYVAGQTAVPPNVSRAALIIIKHMWETQRNTGGGRPGLGDEVSDAYTANPAAYTIPYRALELLGEPVSGIA